MLHGLFDKGSLWQSSWFIPLIISKQKRFSGLFDHLKIIDFHGILSMKSSVIILVTGNDLEQTSESEIELRSLHRLACL